MDELEYLKKCAEILTRPIEFMHWSAEDEQMQKANKESEQRLKSLRQPLRNTINPSILRSDKR